MSPTQNSFQHSAAKMLCARYGMSIMSRSANYDFINLVSECGNVSCIVQDDCFQMGFNQPYGTFNYSKMHLNHIGTASDCAFERCLRLSLASKKSDLDFNDSIHDDDLAYRLKQSADVVPNTKMMYRHLCERVLALEKMVADVSGESESEKVVSYIRTIPRFEVRNYPSSNIEDTNKFKVLYKWLREALDRVSEELSYGMPLEECKKPLSKMTESISSESRVRTRNLFDGVNFEESESSDDIETNEFTAEKLL
ncbi:hypothetical protein WE348_21225 (plasmid) [Alteromonas macleodii]|uniref:hypothetical protein n=1 Tax=Alteromonas macleodii TaxID=28108 RepID=UPI0030CB84B5